MRMRKKPWAEPFIQSHREYVIEDPTVYKGIWAKELNASGPLHVEIGCGKGDYFLGMHKMLPECGFVAIEKDINCAAVAAKKALNEDHDHTLMINGDADVIDTWFNEGEVDVLHLNFSDPWPKKRNAKRRLSSAGFLEKYAKILKADGEIQMKTDNKKLFEYSVAEFSKNGWIINELSVDYRDNNPDGDVMSEYETRFVELGQPIYRVVLGRGVKNA